MTEGNHEAGSTSRSAVLFSVVHDVYQVLTLYPTSLPLADRLERYRERLLRCGRSVVEVDARLERATPVLEHALGSAVSG